jgi:hypothetical protein
MKRNLNKFAPYCAFALTFVFFSQIVSAQSDRWQQEAHYIMDIDMNVETNQYKGVQEIQYTNHSPDTLNRLFYHLYFNAFQPGSMMDIRSQNIIDPDTRISESIKKMKPSDIGFIKVKELSMNGDSLNFNEVGTILEVTLKDAILPGQTVKLVMKWDAQVPLQTRRSGRDNKEGIRYSMAQWYPKLCEYDYQGWHANPYVGREFYSIWGSFDVTIHIDTSYLIGATGVLENAMEVGYGYQPLDISQPRIKKEKTSWHFKADQVGDFVWAADPDYKHFTYRAYDGTLLHFIFQANDETTENWSKLPKILNEALRFMNSRYGKYPYPVYSFIQGGDGGMEYPMATLITGERSLNSLVGVSVHEWMHSWYQCVLGTNESLYAWMDEGFTSFATTETMNHLVKEGLINGNYQTNPFENTYRSFAGFAQSGFEEPLSTHADHFSSNAAYGVGSYTKGAIFLNQLRYIMGEEVFSKALLRYFDTWKFKHPNVNDFIRVMEKTSGLELDWYKEYFINSTHTIDYAVDSVKKLKRNTTTIEFKRLGKMPMPLDFKVNLKNGGVEYYTIPLQIMRGNKLSETEGIRYTVLEDWPWTNPTYSIELPIRFRDIMSIEVDPKHGMMDIDIENNVFVRGSNKSK